MKKTIIKLFDKIILLILGLSGVLYSCMKYGMPEDEFELNGIVTDRANEPIPNIRVIKQNYDNDTLYTNSEGKYSFKFWNEVRFTHLKVEDIDGEENGGEFRPFQLNVVFTEADLVKKGKRNKSGDKYARTENIRLYRIDEEITVMYGPPVAPFEP